MEQKDNNFSNTNATSPQTNIAPVQSQTDTLGIISLVFAFIGLFPIGLILGLIGAKNAKKENRSPVLSRIGWIINLVLTLISLVAILLFIALATFSSTAEKAKEAQSKYGYTQKSELQKETNSKHDFLRGETAVFNNLEVKVNSVTRNFVPKNEYERAKAGKELMVIDLTVKNVGKDSQYVSAYDFKIDEAGLLRDSSYVSPPGTKFNLSSLSPGGSISGQIVYEVNANASNLKLVSEKTVYNPENYSSDQVSYSLAL